jgi:hypothetical protein
MIKTDITGSKEGLEMAETIKIMFGRSVTGRIREIQQQQPFGGYVNPTQMKDISFNDDASYIDDDANILKLIGGTLGKEINLRQNENISPSIVGLAVDYLTRFSIGNSIESAFDISLRGARIADELEIAKSMLDSIHALDEESIINACKLVTYDEYYRGGKIIPHNTINPNITTCSHIKVMVARSISFLRQYGPIIKEEFTFGPSEDFDMEKMMKAFQNGQADGGYTSTVCGGDGDFLTKDTLWDFKVSSYPPNKNNTLQLLMYWIMGQHSGQDLYKNIDKMGIFNPRLNKAFVMNIKDIPESIIHIVEKDVICY